MSLNPTRPAAVTQVLLALGLAAALIPDPARALEGNGFTTKVLGYHVSWRGWTDGTSAIPWDLSLIHI